MLGTHPRQPGFLTENQLQSVDVIAALLAAAALLAGPAAAQKAKVVPGPVFYYNDYEWPLPVEGTTTMKLNGMKSAHAAWISVLRYSAGPPVEDAPVITLLEGSKARWTAPQGGCNYELQLINSNPPVINMTKPPAVCLTRAGAKVVFKVVAVQ